MKRMRNTFLRLIILIAVIQFGTSFLYVNFFGVNLYTKEQSFSKDGHTVFLIGVSHVGEISYYEGIKENKENLFFLVEGVQGITEHTDNHQLWADRLGLVSQKRDTFTGFNHINSDINISKIDPETSRNLSLLIFASSNKENFYTAKKELVKANFSMTDFYQETVIKRNLIIKENIKKYSDRDLVIPWGALHHNNLESFLLKEGYTKSDTKYHKVANLASVCFRLVLGLF